MRRLLYILVLVFLMNFIYAECNETQIDINSASAEELDKIIGIGPTYALRIIEERPFDSVDDLINVNGIGPATLEKIKQQGLACVEKEIEENSEEEQEENDSTEEEAEVIEDEEEEIGEELVYENFSQTTDEKELEPIFLNSKSIKSESDNDDLRKNLALGGIVTFCVMFGALFFLKTRKRKNEFQ